MSKNIITSLCWVKKQQVKKNPIEANNISKLNEMKALEEELKAKANLKGNETIKEMTEKIESSLLGFVKENTQSKEQMVSNIMEEDEDDEFDGIPTFSSEFKQMKGENEEAKDNKQMPNEFDDLSEDEQEDYTIHPSDNLIICATAQDDISNLEIYVYDEQKQNLYVHHDILLSSYPLCLEWLSINEDKDKSKANFAVVGTFLPDIEVWNLDSLDALEPDMVLGDPENTQKYIKSMKKKPAVDSMYHTDAVLGLSLNPFEKKIIASCSADSKVIIWDLMQCKPLINYKEHFDKVQTVKFNKCEDNVMLSGSYDHTIKIYDIRNNKSATQLKVNDDIESIDFSGLNKYRFMVSYETGLVQEYDIMNLSKPVFSFYPHKKAATSVSYCNKANGLFATCSLDSHVKVWDSENLVNDAPNQIAEKFLKKTTGELFCVKFADDIDYTLAVGGSKGELLIWQLEQSKTFCDRYGLKWQGDIMDKNDNTNNLMKKKLMSNRIKFKGAERRLADKGVRRKQK